jgi:hypothetical protein
MREIPLTHGKVALVDDQDYESLAKHKWHARRSGATFYARRNARLPDGRWSMAYMHREIFGADLGVEVDHWNRNGLDNQRENLRSCTHSENQSNSWKRPGLSSRFRGVSWRRDCRKWQVHIRLGPKTRQGRARSVCLGLFVDEGSAAHAYDVAARGAFREFASLNFQEGA